MTTAAVKWGILSTADINRKVIPGAHASEKIELIAVASRDLRRAEEYAREWEIDRAYGSYEALLEDDVRLFDGVGLDHETLVDREQVLTLDHIFRHGLPPVRCRQHAGGAGGAE